MNVKREPCFLSASLVRSGEVFEYSVSGQKKLFMKLDPESGLLNGIDNPSKQCAAACLESGMVYLFDSITVKCYENASMPLLDGSEE